MSQTPISEPSGLAFAERCDRGKVREENQDSILHVNVPLGELLIVADGMGGYKGGATASRMVIESFRAHLAGLPQDYPADQAIKEAAARANTDIYAAAHAPDAEFRRMGSTVVIALLQKNATGTHACIGHVGDSRAYLAQEGCLTRITNDHSAVQALIDSNIITPEQARRHPDASVLMRTLGHKPAVEIEIDQVQLTTGDTLLLCSDGMWGYVTEEDLQKTVANSDLESAAEALLDLALAAGAPDNVGIQLARITPTSAQAQAVPADQSP